ncbi:stretch-activated Ca2+-permeable channel component-domain-containing protein [Cercophora samala]|uniref:Stretch-activated Ca2+-permeable channel component-domain-containing protein n=1 Tax=Cercophora samala TaxID=330535 RepID=A0AA39Z7A8_9PEZI|nr:stretch-activated Ca2+-permeable channel component-domain-containing protein [Cercophora samala]
MNFCQPRGYCCAMHLSPLQSRLAASVVASCLLLLLYLSLFSPHFAVAHGLEPPPPLRRPILFDDDFDDDFSPNIPARGLFDTRTRRTTTTYEPEFLGFDRSIIGRRQDGGLLKLETTKPTPMDLEEGSTARFWFPLSVLAGRESEGRLELRGEGDYDDDDDGHSSQQEDGGNETTTGASLAKRQQQTVYISVNTCKQPTAIEPDKTTMEPPQLTLFVSKSAEYQAPGPLADMSTQEMLPLEEGAVNFRFTGAEDVYIGVHAPNVSDVFEGKYNFEIAVSGEGFYFTYNDEDDADLIWVDSDSQGALLITHNLTTDASPVAQEKIMSMDPYPYVLFAHNKTDKGLNGLRHSWCGLKLNAMIAGVAGGRDASKVRTSMTTRGMGNLPKQQFFFNGLSADTNYTAFLGRERKGGLLVGKRQEGEGGEGGDGVELFKPVDFTTKSDHGNCALITDLEFCNEVAYSVPSNPSFGNSTQLAKFYDDHAAKLYVNFNLTLQQIQCEAGPTQRYSLVRNCTDCAKAYKNWLCSVTIPRCEDFGNTAKWLQARAISQPFPDGERLSEDELTKMPNTTRFNSSRNTRIDEEIRPGPYKELLPCEDLCYDLVRSCPASMGFGCPQPGGVGFEGNYGPRGKGGELVCNFQGSAHVPSSSVRLLPVGWGVMMVVVVVGMVMV